MWPPLTDLSSEHNASYFLVPWFILTHDKCTLLLEAGSTSFGTISGEYIGSGLVSILFEYKNANCRGYISSTNYHKLLTIRVLFHHNLSHSNCTWKDFLKTCHVFGLWGLSRSSLFRVRLSSPGTKNLVLIPPPKVYFNHFDWKPFFW